MLFWSCHASDKSAPVGDGDAVSLVYAGKRVSDAVNSASPICHAVLLC